MTFWIIAAGLLLLALLLLTVPILRQPQAGESTDRQQQNIDIAREKKAQLDQENLSQAEYDSALKDLETALALDLQRVEQGNQQQPGKWAVWLIIVVIPALSIGLYLKLGEYRVITNPALVEVDTRTPANNQDMSIEAMLDRLKQRLRDNPEDAEGWFMMGRTLLSMQLVDQAVAAFQRTYDLVGDQPGVMFTLADALAMQKDGVMTGEPEDLVLRGLQLSPTDSTGLWLAGLAAEQRQDYKAAHAHWLSLLPLIAEDAESSAEVNRLLAELEKRDPDIEPVAVVSPTNSIVVTIDIDETLRAKTDPDDVVFVYATAMQGPPMPLAAKRLRVSDLPTEVSLSDSDAMLANMKLSMFQEVTIGARVSKSGNPIAQPGDLFVEMDSIDSGNPPAGLSLVINRVK
ncbi:MAG: c-type cytochrome biogenesis protein CcmI [Gammaproteobacteria bacterium]|nr:c-type cytochrome biogenesis protein CcmI [Gammaproteobacteria bacterium]